MSAEPPVPSSFSVALAAVHGWLHARLDPWKESVAALARSQPTLFTLLVGGGLVGALGAAPIMWDGWSSYWSLPRAGWVTATVLGGTTAVFAGRRLWPRHRPLAGLPLAHLIVWAWAMACTVVGALVVGAWWVMGAPSLSLPSEVSARALDAAATRAFAVVAGLGGVALLVISYRKQRSTEAEDRRADLAVERETTRLFVDRLDQASEKLGSEHAVIRLAGVHALAHLADDAPTDDLTQTVIDILCSYVRMPHPPTPERIHDFSEKVDSVHVDPFSNFEGLRQVRHTILRVAKERLQEKSRWQGKNFDFTGATFDGGDLDGCKFTGGKISFAGANFIQGSTFSFDRADFFGAEVSFRGCSFHGDVSFSKATFASGSIDFTEADFTGGISLFYDTIFRGGSVRFINNSFAGSATVFAALFCGTTFEISHAQVKGTNILFTGSRFRSGLNIITSKSIEEGKIDFTNTLFDGADVLIHARNSSSGDLDFTGANFQSGRVLFPARLEFDKEPTHGARPKGLFESSKVNSGVLRFPGKWK